jgi:hypothetical protein
MDMTVPKTILEQLGGRRFLAMTGATNLIGSADRLSFTLPGTPGFVRSGINVCRVTLTPMDTYTVEYLRVRGGKVRTVETCTDIYAENLQDCFSRETGLATRL